MTQKLSPQKTAEDHFDGKLTVLLKRDVENGFACWANAKNIDTASIRNVAVRIRDLLKYLKQQHTRWNVLTKDDMNTTNSKFMKALHAHLYSIKRKPDFLRELMDANKDRKDLNDVSDVTTETEEADSSPLEESQRAVDAKILFPEENKDPNADKAKAEKPKPKQAKVQEATRAGSMLGKRTSEVILSYEEACNAQEFFRCVKRAKLLQAEMQSLKRRMEEIA